MMNNGDLLDHKKSASEMKAGFVVVWAKWSNSVQN